MLKDIQILHIPSSGTTQYVKHTWVAHVNNLCVGHIHLQREADKKIKFLDAWVHEDYRRQGIFRALWDTRWKFVNKENNINYNINKQNYNRTFNFNNKVNNKVNNRNNNKIKVNNNGSKRPNKTNTSGRKSKK